MNQGRPRTVVTNAQALLGHHVVNVDPNRLDDAAR